MFTQAQKAIQLARNHVADNAKMESSARICLADAINLFDRDEYRDAIGRAMRSLSFSVGIHHSDFQKVVDMNDKAREAEESAAYEKANDI
jgi:hypothetical protein